MSEKATVLTDASAPFAPTRPKLRARHLQKRDEMLQGALQIVAREGLEGLTIAKLAKHLGAATGALYRYFPGKSDLVGALQQEALGTFAESLEAALTTLEKAKAHTAHNVFSLARPIAALLTWRRQAEARPEAYALLDAMLSTPFEVLDLQTMRATEAELQTVLTRGAALFDEATTAGCLHPGDGALRVRVAWACLHGIDHMRKRDRIEAPPYHSARLADEALRGLFQGWGAAPEMMQKALAVAHATICA